MRLSHILNNLKFDQSFGRHLQLIGDGGMGKSTLLHDLWHECSSSLNKMIPIYIPLYRFDDQSKSYRHYIRREIIRLYIGICAGDMQVNYIHLEKMLNDPEGDYQYIIMLDGYNEVTNSFLMKHEIIELANLRNSRIILSSRYELSDYASFGKLKILPLDQAVVDQKTDTSEMNEQLKRLLSIPFYLSIYTGRKTDVGIISEQRIFTAGELLNAHRKRLLWKLISENFGYSSIESEHYRLADYALEYLLPSLSYEFERQKRYSFTYADFKVETMRCKEQMLMDNYDVKYESLLSQAPERIDDKLLRLLIDTQLIIKMGENHYVFQHENIRDFYAAYHVYVNMENKRLKVLEISLSFSVKAFVGNLFQEYEYKSLGLMNRLSPVVNVMNDYSGKFDGTAATPLANCFEIVQLARDSQVIDNFYELDFSEVPLHSCKNYGISVQKTSGSEFNRCKFSSDTFIPKGHNKEIVSLKLSESETLLATSSEDSTTKVWDLSSGKCIGNYMGLSRNMFFIENDTKLLCCQPDAIRLIAIEDGTQTFMCRLKTKFLEDTQKRVFFEKEFNREVWEYMGYEFFNSFTRIKHHILAGTSKGRLFKYDINQRKLREQRVAQQFAPLIKDTRANVFFFQGEYCIIETKNDKNEKSVISTECHDPIKIAVRTVESGRVIREYDISGDETLHKVQYIEEKQSIAIAYSWNLIIWDLKSNSTTEQYAVEIVEEILRIEYNPELNLYYIVEALGYVHMVDISSNTVEEMYIEFDRGPNSVDLVASFGRKSVAFSSFLGKSIELYEASTLSLLKNITASSREYIMDAKTFNQMVIVLCWHKIIIFDKEAGCYLRSMKFENQYSEYMIEQIDIESIVIRKVTYSFGEYPKIEWLHWKYIEDVCQAEVIKYDIENIPEGIGFNEVMTLEERNRVSAASCWNEPYLTSQLTKYWIDIEDDKRVYLINIHEDELLMTSLVRDNRQYRIDLSHGEPKWKGSCIFDNICYIGGENQILIVDLNKRRWVQTYKLRSDSWLEEMRNLEFCRKDDNLLILSTETANGTLVLQSHEDETNLEIELISIASGCLLDDGVAAFISTSGQIWLFDWELYRSSDLTFERIDLESHMNASLLFPRLKLKYSHLMIEPAISRSDKKRLFQLIGTHEQANRIYYLDGQLVTGDSTGKIKLWDHGKKDCVEMICRDLQVNGCVFNKPMGLNQEVSDILTAYGAAINN